MRQNIYLGLIILCSLISIKSFGQSFPQGPTEIEVIYTNPSGVNLCRGGNEFTVELRNPSATNTIAAGAVANYTLPNGMEFESLVTTGAATVGGSGSTPSFTFTNSIPPGGSQVVTFTSSVNCETFQFVENNALTSLSNGISVDYTSGGVLSNIARDATALTNYNFTFTRPVISLTATNMNGNVNHPQTYTAPGELLTQRIQVNLEGNGENLERFFVEVDLPANLSTSPDGLVCGVTSNTGLTPDPGSINVVQNGGKWMVELVASDFGQPGGFQAGVDEFIIDLCYTPDCSVGDPQIINYNTAVDCFGNPCAITSAEGSFTQVPVFGTLLGDAGASGDPNFCGTNSAMSYTLRSVGLGPVFDPVMRTEFDAGFLTLTNFTIQVGSGGSAVSVPALDALFAASGGGLVISTVSDFIDLWDVNGDGVFGEIPSGEQVIVAWEIAYDFGGNGCGEEYNGATVPLIVRPLYSRNECSGVRWGGGINRRFNWQHTDTLTVAGGGCKELSIRNDDEKDQIATYCTSVNYWDQFGNLLNDDWGFFVDVSIPCGFELTQGVQPTVDLKLPSGDFLNVPLQTANLGGSSWRFATPTNDYDLLGGLDLTRTANVCFNIPISTNCDAQCVQDLIDNNDWEPCDSSNCVEGDSLCNDELVEQEKTLSPGGMAFFQAFAVMTECLNNPLGIGCEETAMIPACDKYECPSTGIADVNTTSFELTRSTFGFVPGSNFSTRYTYQQVLNGTIPEDVNVRGAYACDEVVAHMIGEISCAATNGIMSEFEYIVPSTYGKDFFTDVSGVFIINGVSVPGTYVPTPVDNDVAKHTLILENYVINVGDVVEAVFTMKVHEDVNEHNAPNLFPDWYEIAGLEGQLRNIEAPSKCPECPFFEIFSIDSRTRCRSAHAFCGRRSLAVQEFEYWGGHHPDDFLLEDRPFVNFVNYSAEFANATVLQESGILATNALTAGILGVGTVQLVYSQNGLQFNATNNPNQLRLIDKNQLFQIMFFQVWMEPSCRFNSVDPFMTSTIELQRNFYAEDQDCIETEVEVCEVKMIFTNNADPKYNPLTTTQIATTNEVSFTGELSNPAGNVVHPWIRITFPENIVNVVNGAQLPYGLNGALGETYNVQGNQLFLALSSIDRALPTIGELDVQLLDCSEDQVVEIQIETGYSCTPITSDPFDAAFPGELCATDIDIVTLELLRTNVELDVFTYFPQSETQPFCEELCFMTQTFNDERGNLFDPFLMFDIPDGMDITSFRYRYPITSDQIISETFDQGTFDYTGFVSVDVSTVSDATPWNLLDGAGSQMDFLAGTISNPDNNLNTVDNYFQSEVCFTPTCDYNFAQDIVIETGGDNACGEELSQDFRIRPRYEGVEGLEGYDPTLTFTSTPGLACGSQTITLTYENDVDISHLLKDGDVLTIRNYRNGIEFVTPLDGTIGTHTYQITHLALPCTDIWFDAVISIALDISCRGVQCENGYELVTDRFVIPYVQGEISLDLNLIENACEFETANASVTITNSGSIDLFNVDVLVMCDANNGGIGDGGLSVGDRQLVLITIPVIPAGATINHVFDIPNLRSCGSGRIFAMIPGTEYCNCEAPLVDTETYTCCPLIDITINATINCKGELEVSFTGNDLASIPVPQDITISDVGTFSINDFTVPYVYDVDPKLEKTYVLSMDLPRTDCIDQTIETTENWVPKSLSTMGFPRMNACNLAQGTFAILPEEGVTLTNIVWTFDTEGANVEVQGGLNATYNFVDKGLYTTCVYAEDQDSCVYYVCRDDNYPEPFPIMTITQEVPLKCGEEHTFTLESVDAPRHLTWVFSNEDGSIVYESRYVPGIDMQESFTFPGPGTYKVFVSGISRDGTCDIEVETIVVIDECCPDPITLEPTIDCKGNLTVDIIGYVEPHHTVSINWGDQTFGTSTGGTSFTKQYTCDQFGEYLIEVVVTRGPNCDPIYASVPVTWQSTGAVRVQTSDRATDLCNSAEITFVWLPMSGVQLTNFVWTPNKDQGGQPLTDHSGTVTHNFVTEGNHTMHLCAEDENGCVYGTVININITNPIPVMDLVVTQGDCETPWKFELISSDGIRDIEWTLTDPNGVVETPIGDITMFTRDFIVPGTYTISAYAGGSRGAGGCEIFSDVETFPVVPECCTNFVNTISGSFIDCHGEFNLAVSPRPWDGHVVTIDWGDPDDGTQTVSTDGTFNFTHNYANPASHNIIVTIDRGNGCPAIVIHQTFTYEPLTLNTISNISDWCEPAIRIINIIDIPDGVVLNQVNWNTPDGTTLTMTHNQGKTAIIDFGGIGSYNTTVTAIDQNGCEYETIRTDNIVDGPAEISIATTEGDCQNNTPWTFNVVSNDEPQNLVWTVTRDGQPFPISPNTGNSISEVFTISGVYEICVTGSARGANECPVDDCTPITVNCCNTEGSFDVNAQVFCADVPFGNPVHITNVTKTPDLAETTTVFQWLDESLVPFGTPINYTWTQWYKPPLTMGAPLTPGTYYIRMTTVHAGCPHVALKEITVRCCNTEVDFNIEQTEYCTFGNNTWPGYVRITDMTNAPGGSWTTATMEIRNQWNVIVASQNVNYVSNQDFYFAGTEGTYTATMKVVARECEDEITKTFEIKECPCDVEIDISTDINCKGEAKVTVTGDIDVNSQFNVDWGGGVKSLNLHSWQLNHNYPQEEGTYCIKVTLIDPNCPAEAEECEYYKPNTITIVPNQIGCNGEQINFTIPESSSIHSVMWYVDGTWRNVGGVHMLEEQFTTAGTYVISVKAFDWNGCPVYGEVSVRVGGETCDPNLKADVKLLTYNSGSGIYTVDMTGSTGDIDYYYYSTNGPTGPWKVSETGIFQIGDDCGGQVCTKVGNNVCDEPVAPYKDMCESAVECIDLNLQNQ